MQSRTKNALYIFLGSILAVGAIASLLTRPRPPQRLVLATGASGGRYAELGARLAEDLESAGLPLVDTVKTSGARENVELIRDGRADLGFYQAGLLADPPKGVTMVTNLYSEVTHVAVRGDLEEKPITALEGRRVHVGLEGAGSETVARFIFGHYGLLDDVELVYGPLDEVVEKAKGGEIEAAVITVGFGSQVMGRLFRETGFRLLPLPEADALAYLGPALKPMRVPRGMYRDGQGGPVPGAAVDTVATRSQLIAAADLPPQTVGALLKELFVHRNHLPELRQDFGSAPGEIPLHEGAWEFFYPGRERGISTTTYVAAAFVLIFVIGFVLYLTWRHRLRMQHKMEQYILRLDELEENVVACAGDRNALERCLTELRMLKRHCGEEMSREELDITSNTLHASFATLYAALEAKLLWHLERIEAPAPTEES